jgi:flagellar assembly protein FliH
MAQTFESLQQDLAPEVLALACEMAAQVIRAELVLGPEKLLPLLQHTTASLPLPERPCAVELHPEDLELVTRLAPLDSAHWQAQANTRLERGGFVIRTPHGQVDARLETRWQLLMRVLGQDLAWPQPGQDAHG